MAKFRGKKRRNIVDDGYTYLILNDFTRNIGILFGSPKSIVQLEGEKDAPKTLIYESTLQHRKWLDIKLNLCDFYNDFDLPESATIKDWISTVAAQSNKLESLEIKRLLDDPAVIDEGEAPLSHLFNLAISIFDDNHQLIAIETIGTLHPEIKANYSGGTSRLFSKEFHQEISIADFTVYALAMREAISHNNLNDAKAIAFEKIHALLGGIQDKHVRSEICREVALALLEKSSEALIKEVIH